MDKEENSYGDEETVMEFTCLGDRWSAGGGCVAAVNARPTCRWIKLRKCSELLYGRRIRLRLRGAGEQLKAERI